MLQGVARGVTYLRCRQRGCAACPWCCCSGSAAPSSGQLGWHRAPGCSWGAGGCAGGGDSYPRGGTKHPCPSRQGSAILAPFPPCHIPPPPVGAQVIHHTGGSQPCHAGGGWWGGAGDLQETPGSRGVRSGHSCLPSWRVGRTAGILRFRCAQTPLQQAELLCRQHPQQVPAVRGRRQPHVTAPLLPHSPTRGCPLPPAAYLIFFRRL